MEIAYAADSGIVQGLNNIIPGGLGNIINLGLMFGALLGLGVVIYAGILFSMSGDNSSKQKEAKEWIWAAVKGLAVLAFGYLLIVVINPSLTTVKEIDIPELSYDEDIVPDYNSSPITPSGSAGFPLRSISIGGSVYGTRCHPIKHCCRVHGGIDLQAACHSDVLAVDDGKVSELYDPSGFGKYIVIKHSNGTASYYAHLSEYSVPNGAQVKKGDKIAESGGAAGDPGAGLSTGCHLHFEIRKIQGGSYVSTNVNLMFGVDGKRAAMESACPKGPTCNKNQDCNGNPK